MASDGATSAEVWQLAPPVALTSTPLHKVVAVPLIVAEKVNFPAGAVGVNAIPVPAS
jgi:hypothetical protein